MPRDSQSNYSLPTNYQAVTGQTAQASQHNSPLEDIATALTGSLARNGTGAMQANLPMGGFKITGLADAAASDEAVSKAQIDSLLPVGVVMDWAGATEPDGWLFCDGQAVSRSTYSALFTAIGTAHGIGDGSTTFNLPDLRGRVVAGKDDMGGTSANRLTNQSGGLNGDVLGAAGGAETHTLTTAQLPAHAHGAGTLAAGAGGSSSPNISVQGTGSDNGSVSVFGGGHAANASVSGAISIPNHTHPITGSTANAGSGSAHNNVQPTIILNKIIRTGV